MVVMGLAGFSVLSGKLVMGLNALKAAIYLSKLTN